MDRAGIHRLEEDLRAREPSEGLKMTDLLELPEPLSGMLNWMMRQEQVTIAELTAYLGADEAGVRDILAGLRNTGWVREIEICGQAQYSVRLAHKRRNARSSNIWQI